MAPLDKYSLTTYSGSVYAFCYSSASLPQFADEVKRQGFAIYKLEGCPA
ncbi:hypothetical protein [Motilimonas pumila]|nr:hypothetical protein [Motilimonas pumila]